MLSRPRATSERPPHHTKWWCWPRREKEKKKLPSSALFEATRMGDTETVRALLRDGRVDVDARNEFGFTALYYAAMAGRVSLVKLLLEAGSDRNAHFKPDDSTLLHMGIRESVMKVLLDGNFDVNARDNRGATPLHSAVLHETSELLPLLIEAKSDVNARDTHGRTPLHYSASRSNVKAMQILLEANADVLATDKGGRTPLHTAISAYDAIDASVQRRIGMDTMEVLQLLAVFGARWDEVCEELVRQRVSLPEASALSVCFSFWEREAASGLVLSNIPLDIISDGDEATQAYVASLKISSGAPAA